VNGASVPPIASAAMISNGPGLVGMAGMPSVITATGSTTREAARNCTAVTATGSRPRSSRVCATVKVAEISSDTRTRPSPPTVAPPP
jgi:hypothetical protein